MIDENLMNNNSPNDKVRRKKKLGNRNQDFQTEDLVVAPPVGKQKKARTKTRLAASMFIFVWLPVLVVSWYITNRAADRYTTHLSFNVFKSEVSAPTDLMSQVSGAMSGASKESEMLYRFINSPDLVNRLSKHIDFGEIYSRTYAKDPIFSLRPDAKIEEKTEYWNKMVRTNLETAGLIQVEITAFSEHDTLHLSELIMIECRALLDRLNDESVSEMTQQTKENLEKHEFDYQTATELTKEYRISNKIIDPLSDFQIQMSLISNLQLNLANQKVELNLLRNRASSDDARVRALEQRIAALKNEVDAERNKFGDSKSNIVNARVVSEYEQLQSNQMFFKELYFAGLNAYNASLQKAKQSNAFIQPYIAPVKPEEKSLPNVAQTIGLTFLLSFITWLTSLTVIRTLRERL